MKKTFKLVLKKNVEGNEWVVRVYINGKYDEGKTYYGDDNKEDAEASMLDMRSKLKKAGYEEEIKEGNNMKSTFKTIKEEVIEERKIIDGIKKGIRGVVDVLDAAIVPRGIVGGEEHIMNYAKSEPIAQCSCGWSKSYKGEGVNWREIAKKEHMGDKEGIKEESLEELKEIVDQILEEQDISDVVGEFFELMVNLPIHSAPPLYFWKQLMENANIAKMAYDKNRGIGRN